MTQLTGEEKQRIRSIDLVRGLVMIIMALDHSRDFFHLGHFTADPLDLATTTPVLYFTRWITHYCAPIFVFLSGVSAYLSGQRKTKAQLSAFLIKRGFWLIFVELAIISLAITFNPLYNFFLLQVIQAIGVSMIVLGLLVRGPFYLIAALGLMIFFGHNALDYADAAGFGKDSRFYHFLHIPEVWVLSSTRFAFMAYPVLPWIGVMFTGYAFGKLFEPEFASKRRQIFTITGLSLIALFFALRATNNYGNPTHWTTQKSPLFTFLSFINVTKYPPSLLYLCMTIGPGILMLAWLEKVQNRFTDFLNIYGRVPFFYYVLHFFLIHFLLMITFLIMGYGAKDIVSQNNPILFQPDTLGFSLPAVYLIWAGVILLLYFPCRWFNRYKSTHRQWWLSYL